MPIWLRRWALLQLAARKGEYWEMRSLGVIKAPCLAGACFTPTGSSCLAHGVGSRAVELEAQLNTPAWTQFPLGQRALAQHSWCHFPTW